MGDVEDWDPISDAFEALDDGASCGEIVQRFALHAARAERLGELEDLLVTFDQDTGRRRLLSWLVEAVDTGELRPTGTDG